MNILVRDKAGNETHLGEFEDIEQAKEYWIDGDDILRQMVNDETVVFEEIKDD